MKRGLKIRKKGKNIKKRITTEFCASFFLWFIFYREIAKPLWYPVQISRFPFATYILKYYGRYGAANKYAKQMNILRSHTHIQSYKENDTLL